MMELKGLEGPDSEALEGDCIDVAELVDVLAVAAMLSVRECPMEESSVWL